MKSFWVPEPKVSDVVYLLITPPSTRKFLYLGVLPIVLMLKVLFEQRETSFTFKKISWNYTNALAVCNWHGLSSTTLKNENLKQKKKNIKLPPKYIWNFWEFICSRCPNLWFCSSIRHIRSAVTWGFLSSSPLSLSTMSRLVMVFRGIYDAFLRYWLVVAFVALSVPILDDKKQERNKKYMFYI